MAGVSLSVLPLDDRRLARLDANTDAQAWRPAPPRWPAPVVTETLPPTPTRPEPGPPQTTIGRALGKAIRSALDALQTKAATLTELDRLVGDGDFGDSVTRGIEAIRRALPTYPLDDPASTLEALSLTVEGAMGGTSGALYGIFFLRGATGLRIAPPGEPSSWGNAFEMACRGITDLGGARPGDRTMLDALVPAASTFRADLEAGRNLPEALRHAADAAVEGARATADLAPRRGRSSYLGERVLGHQDPGAFAAATWLGAVASMAADQTGPPGS
jgi:dihydroxyacetone kinase